jgi:hypothetical protein
MEIYVVGFLTLLFPVTWLVFGDYMEEDEIFPFEYKLRAILREKISRVKTKKPLFQLRWNNGSQFKN